MDEQDRFKRFEDAYNGSAPAPWDSGIVPPEVRALAEGPDALLPGRALDVGCGTGVSAVYLARHGWTVTGVDWVAGAIIQARDRAGLAELSRKQVRFMQADVAAPAFLPAHPAVNLWLDIGCLHGLRQAGRQQYAAHAARLIAPGGVLRLYGFQPYDRNGELAGLDPETVQALFATAFALESVTLGKDTAADTRSSAWYRLRRVTA